MNPVNIVRVYNKFDLGTLNLLSGFPPVKARHLREDFTLFFFINNVRKIIVAATIRKIPV